MTHHASKGGTSTLLVVVIVFTIIALILGGIYMSGAADDVVEYFAKQFFKAKAKAEEKALEHAGSEKAQGFLKGMPMLYLWVGRGLERRGKG